MLCYSVRNGIGILDLILELHVLLLTMLFNCGCCTVLMIREAIFGLLIKLLFILKFVVVELIKLS